MLCFVLLFAGLMFFFFALDEYIFDGVFCAFLKRKATNFLKDK